MSRRKIWGLRIAVNTLVALALLVGLTAQAQASNNKATWITQTGNYTLTKMDQVDSFMWFNNYKPETGEPDWRVVSTPPPPATDAAVVNAYNNAWSNGTRSLQRGVFIEGVPASASNLDTFEYYVGHHDRVGWYESFASDFPLASIQRTVGHGSRPYIVWEPYDVNVGVTALGNQSLLPKILSNDPLVNYDARIRSWAQAAKDFNDDIDIVFGHEMNGFFRSWGYLSESYYSSNGGNPLALTSADMNTPGHNGNTPQMFVDAFKHVVDIFNEVGADKVNFVWDVNADWVDTFSLAFPGTAYVDRMGMNGFNWGLSAQTDPYWLGWDNWREGEHIFDDWNGFSTYDALVALPGDLPIIIGETGTNNTPEPATLAIMAAGSLLLFRKRRR